MKVSILAKKLLRPKSRRTKLMVFVIYSISLPLVVGIFWPYSFAIVWVGLVPIVAVWLAVDAAIKIRNVIHEFGASK